MLGVVRAYRVVLSPLLGPAKCRFYPSCSEYAVAVLKRDGVRVGLRRIAHRLSICHPLSRRGGLDLP